MSTSRRPWWALALPRYRTSSEIVLWSVASSALTLGALYVSVWLSALYG